MPRRRRPPAWHRRPVRCTRPATGLNGALPSANRSRTPLAMTRYQSGSSGVNDPGEICRPRSTPRTSRRPETRGLAHVTSARLAQRLLGVTLDHGYQRGPGQEGTPVAAARRGHRVHVLPQECIDLVPGARVPGHLRGRPLNCILQPRVTQQAPDPGDLPADLILVTNVLPHPCTPPFALFRHFRPASGHLTTCQPIRQAELKGEGAAPNAPTLQATILTADRQRTLAGQT